MKKILPFSFILFLFCGHSVFSQEMNNQILCTPESSEYSLRYTKLRKLYVEMQNSESTKTFIALKNDFLDKSNYNGSKREIITQGLNGANSINHWVLDNIEKTDFKSCSEAETAITKGIAANLQIHIDNKELYNYLEETYKICPQLCVNLLLELQKVYGKDFQL